MASKVTIICPHCWKEIKGPADLEGKTLRCKECGNKFVAKAASPAQPAAKAKAKPAPAQRAAKADDDEDASPYGVTDEDLSARCPHCAAKLESEDVVLCVECGFNLKTREHLGTRKIEETTGEDVLMWLVPGILCVVGILVILVVDVVLVLWYCHPKTFPPEEARSLWTITKKGFFLWMIIGSLYLYFLLGRYAIKRLILHPKPPEKQIN